MGFKSKPVKDVRGKTKRTITVDPQRMQQLIYRYVPQERQGEMLELIKPKQKELEVQE